MVELMICECGKVVTVNQYNRNHRNTKLHINSLKRRRKERKENKEEIIKIPERKEITFSRYPYYFIYDYYYGKD